MDVSISPSRGIAAKRRPVDTFSFVARPTPQSDSDIHCFAITSWQRYEKEAGGDFLEADLPTGVVAYIERHYDASERGPDDARS